DLLPPRERLLGDVALLMRPLQLCVCLRDIGGKREAGGRGVDFGRFRLSQCAFERRPVLAPEVELPAKRCLQLVLRVPGSREWWGNEAALRETLRGRLEIGIHLRRQGRLRNVGEGERLARTGGGNVERRAIVERLVDQPVEIWIA